MTIKGYVLDALQKFWNKLKTTYVTDCETDDDNLALAASQGKVLGDRTAGISRDNDGTHLNDQYVYANQNFTVGGSHTNSARFIVKTASREVNLNISANTNNAGIWDATRSEWILQSSLSNGLIIIPHILHATNDMLAKSDATYRPVICTSAGIAGQIALMSTTTSYQLHITSNWGNASANASSRYIATSVSDRRLKENIEPNAKSGLALINALEVKQFDWKESSRHWDYGIIAQEVRDLDPNLVIGEEKEDSYLGIDTLYLSNALVKAVQELTFEVEKLKAEVEYLKTNK